MLKRLSPRGELLLINLLCFGPFAAMSMAGLLRRETYLVYDDRRLYTIVAIELVAGTLAVLILRARGWKLSDLGMKVSMPLTIAGLMLYVAATVVITGGYRLFVITTDFDPKAATTPVATASWLAVLLILAIDPIYEETLNVAYNVRAAGAGSPAFAITLSAVIRFVCHAYQGPIAAITILPLGLIFAFLYWKGQRVWPLVIAHATSGYYALAPES